MPKNKSPFSEFPFIAPCREVQIDAPLRWLKQGIADTKRLPVASLGYGTLMASMMMLMTIAAWQLGSTWIMLMLLCDLVF